jgi:hypothetical protein
MKSILMDKAEQPTNNILEGALGNTFAIWTNLVKFTLECYPNAVCEWNYSSEKFGWSFRIKDKKRVLVYLLPRDQFFKTAFVFGPKALDKIMESDVADFIKLELVQAKAYAEGRGIRIDIKDVTNLVDIENLIRIKISNLK